MNNIAFQDYYPDELSHCYGCGKNNEQGHQLKSYWYQDEQNQGNIDKTMQSERWGLNLHFVLLQGL